MDAAIGPDYVGGGIKGIQDFASGAADALRDLADGLGTGGKLSKEAAKEAKRQAEAYADLTRGAEQFIQSQTLEQQALGLTSESAARLRYQQELLNKAVNDNIKLTPAMRDELAELAAGMAAAEEKTRLMTERFDIAKEFLSGWGSGLWEVFRKGGSAVDFMIGKVDQLIGRLLDSQIDNLLMKLISPGLMAQSSLNPLGFLFGGNREFGGPVQSGVAYRINENTPNSEFFVPNVSGAVLPAGTQRGGGGGNRTQIAIQNHYTVSGTMTDQDVANMIRAGNQQTAAQIEQSVKQQLPGWQADIQVHGAA